MENLKSKGGAEQFSWPRDFNFLFCVNIFVWHQNKKKQKSDVHSNFMIGTSQFEILLKILKDT